MNAIVCSLRLVRDGSAIDDLPRFRRKRRSTERLLNEFATPDSIPWRTQRQTCTVS
jgi:hypothetical protein